MQIRRSQKTESLVLSEELRESLDLLQKVREETSGMRPRVEYVSQNMANLIYPYVELYHQRQSLVDIATEHLALNNQRYIVALVDYLEARVGSEFTEAVELANRGKVIKRHWTKFFPIGTVVVDHKSAEPAAYLLQAWSLVGHGGLRLKC